MRTPWALVVAALTGAALAYSTPTKTDIDRALWLPVLAGVKADWRDRQQTPTGQAVRSVLATVPLLPSILDQAKETELNRLPALWAGHSEAESWLFATFYRYREENCSSSYIAVPGAIVAVSDGCGVEPYRTKGGTGS